MNHRSFAEILADFTEENPAVTSVSANTPKKTTYESPLNSLNFSHQSQFEISQIGLLDSPILERLKVNSHFKNKSHYHFKNYKNAQSQKNYQESSTTSCKRKTENKKQDFIKTQPETRKRVTGKPHKLNDRQQKAINFFINNYEFLLEDFTEVELKKAFKKLCFKFHPDHSLSNTHESFIELKGHFEALRLVFN
ncbi:MAG: hypothetical protein HUU56_14730 [Bdellovibrionaceae bacterium]|nr:hypothetical protein [Pseudobdellovibrionaceae bacterium]